jgi:hypothetical protein
LRIKSEKQLRCVCPGKYTSLLLEFEKKCLVGRGISKEGIISKKQSGMPQKRKTIYLKNTK